MHRRFVRYGSGDHAITSDDIVGLNTSEPATSTPTEAAAGTPTVTKA